jgi:hypothetical protein
MELSTQAENLNPTGAVCTDSESTYTMRHFSPGSIAWWVAETLMAQGAAISRDSAGNLDPVQADIFNASSQRLSRRVFRRMAYKMSSFRGFERPTIIPI